MSGRNPPLIFQIAVDHQGNPAPGAALYHYVTNTTIPKAIYSTYTLTPGTELPQPLIADAEGRYPQYFLESGQYTFTEYDAPLPTGNQLRAPAGHIEGAAGDAYVLPVATDTTLGGVKEGPGTSVAPDGTISTTFDNIPGPDLELLDPETLVVQQLTGVGAGLLPVVTDFSFPANPGPFPPSQSGGRGIAAGRSYVGGIQVASWCAQANRGDLFWSFDYWATSLQDQSLSTAYPSGSPNWNSLAFVYMAGFSKYAWIAGDAENPITYYALHEPASYNVDGSIKVAAWQTLTYPAGAPNQPADFATAGNVTCWVGNDLEVARTADFVTFTSPLTLPSIPGGIATDSYGTWLVVCRDSGLLYRSTDDAVTWGLLASFFVDGAAASALPIDNGEQWGAILGAYGLWVAVNFNPAPGSLSYVWSEDGVHWTRFTGEFQAFYSAGFDGVRFYGTNVASGATTSIYQLLISSIPAHRRLAMEKGFASAGPNFLTDLPGATGIETDQNGKMSDMELGNPTDTLKGAAKVWWRSKSVGAWLDLFRGSAVNVLEYGADPTGATSSDAAVLAAMAVVTASVVTDPFGGDRLSRKYLYFPAGSYLLSEGILTASTTLKARGYKVAGDGPGLTEINFVTASGKRLFHNNNAYLWIEVYGILFNSNSRTNDFMYSYSNPPGGAIQRNKFIDCEWSGQWGRAFYLEGGNNNSEWHFLHCGVSGGMTNFLYTPAGTASDQFLNFWFTHMKFWPTDTSTPNNWIEINLGGHIHIKHCDVSGYQNGTLFKLKGIAHALGVCSFSAKDVRYEMKTVNTKVIECEWPQGSVTFDDNDWSSQRGVSGIDAVVMFDFNDVNFAGAKVAFRQCSMIGLIRFAHNSDDFRFSKVTTFDSCDFQQEEPYLAFVFTSSTNDAGHRAVILRACRGTYASTVASATSWAALTAYTVLQQRRVGSQLYEVTIAGTSGATAPAGKDSAIVDGTVTWKWVRTEARNYLVDQTVNSFSTVASNGLVEHYAIFRQSDGNWPLNGGRINYILPPNAIIVKTNLYFDGTSGSFGTGSNFEIATDENTPTVFSTVNQTPGSTAFANEWSGFFPVGTDIKKRSLNLVSKANVTAFTSRGVAVVRYLA